MAEFGGGEWGGESSGVKGVGHRPTSHLKGGRPGVGWGGWVDELC